MPLGVGNCFLVLASWWWRQSLYLVFSTIVALFPWVRGEMRVLSLVMYWFCVFEFKLCNCKTTKRLIQGPASLTVRWTLAQSLSTDLISSSVSSGPWDTFASIVASSDL
jgi:hypothetical protein